MLSEWSQDLKTASLEVSHGSLSNSCFGSSYIQILIQLLGHSIVCLCDEDPAELQTK